MSPKSALTRPGVDRCCRVVCVLWVLSMATEAQEAPGHRTVSGRECLRDDIDAHVIAQFAKYGPLSKDREYFGFIFRTKGEISSAITRGGRCKGSCGVNTAAAAAQVPPAAKPLGEWHTHPRESGGGTLSVEDVRGAYSHRNIRCYTAYYSQPDGDIYAWDPHQSLVPDAMASRFYIGNYVAERRLGVDRRYNPARENPGMTCLSTNTNAHIAVTTKKYCRRSPTSR